MVITPVKHIYEKFLNGDELCDDELRAGILHFSKMEELLSKSGPHFKLAWLEAFRVAQRLKEYRQERKHKGKY